MATLTINRLYEDGEILTEADLDAICDSVETFLNTTKINDDNIQNAGITGSTKLAALSVSRDRLAADIIDNTKLADDAVQTENILNDAVTTAKIDDDAVTTAKILDANVTRAKLAVGGIGRDSLPTAKTTTYTATTSDDVIRCDTSGGAWTLTLFSAASLSGRRLTVIKTTSDFSVLTIDGDGSETINGAATTSLNTQWESVTLISDGTNWVIENRYVPSVWTQYTPSYGSGFGSCTTLEFWWKREGDGIHIRGNFVCGTIASAAANATVSIPSGLNIDTAKIYDTNSSTYSPMTGRIKQRGSSSNDSYMVVSVTTSTTLLYASGQADQFMPGNAAVMFSSNFQTEVSTFHPIPISGWNG